MLSILPKFEQKEHKAELIFVVDRSGSMDGDGIRQAKKALLVNIPIFSRVLYFYSCQFSQLFIHSLRTDSYVNIVGFGSEYHLLFPEGSRKYDDEVLKIAKEYAEGTLIYKSLSNLPLILSLLSFLQILILIWVEQKFWIRLKQS